MTRNFSIYTQFYAGEYGSGDILDWVVEKIGVSGEACYIYKEKVRKIKSPFPQSEFFHMKRTSGTIHSFSKYLFSCIDSLDKFQSGKSHSIHVLYKFEHLFRNYKLTQCSKVFVISSNGEFDATEPTPFPFGIDGKDIFLDLNNFATKHEFKKHIEIARIVEV